jgi:Dullard-like phosphatase family protein
MSINPIEISDKLKQVIENKREGTPRKNILPQQSVLFDGKTPTVVMPTYGAFGSPSKLSNQHDLDEDEMEDLRKLVLNSADKRAICPDFSDSPEIRPRANHRKPDLNPEFLFQPMDSDVQPITKFLLPPKIKDRAYTLVVDLDETLIHFDREKKLFFVRPYTRHFLRELSKWYEIVVFTAAQQDYTDFILQKVDVESTISHRLYREHTVCMDNLYIKDLSRLGRNLATTIIVDNNPRSFQLQPSNGIYVRTWTSDPNDKALLRLAAILADVASKGFPDIRRALRRLKDKMMAVFAIEGKMPQDVHLSSELSSSNLM